MGSGSADCGIGIADPACRPGTASAFSLVRRTRAASGPEETDRRVRLPRRTAEPPRAEFAQKTAPTRTVRTMVERMATIPPSTATGDDRPTGLTTVSSWRIRGMPHAHANGAGRFPSLSLGFPDHGSWVAGPGIRVWGSSLGSGWRLPARVPASSSWLTAPLLLLESPAKRISRSSSHDADPNAIRNIQINSVFVPERTVYPKGEPS
jgi:hypothetical protein